MEKRQSSYSIVVRLPRAITHQSTSISVKSPKILYPQHQVQGLRLLHNQAFYPAQLEDSSPRELSRQQVLGYVRDLKEVLSEGTIVEQKAFLRSFIKRIEFEPGQVTIDYTIPLPTEKDGAIEREVLSIKQIGSAGRTRTYDQAVNSRPLYR